MRRELQINTFKELQLKDADPLQKFLFQNQPRFCEFSFVNLFLWNIISGYSWKFYENRLLIYSNRFDVMLMPIGERSPLPFLLTISDALRDQSKKGDFAFIDLDYLNQNQNTGIQRHFKGMPDRDNADYVYRSADLAELKGRKFQRKRNLIHQFENQFPDYRVLQMENRDTDSCFQLAEKWCRDKACIAMGAEHEFSALHRAFQFFPELSLEGLLIKVQERIVGFSIFSFLNSETFTVHFEKFDPEIKGSAQFINRETAKFLKNRANYLNREQDLGLSGLRRAKMSYYPDMILEPYNLVRI